MLQKNIFRFQPLLPFFGLKTAKIDQNEENAKIYNCLMILFEIWYVDASQQNKMLQKTIFRFRHFFAFFGQKTAKID